MSIYSDKHFYIWWEENKHILLNKSKEDIAKLAYEAGLKLGEDYWNP